ncbi:MAG TPA: GNAT family N-acetyltransferase [Saprospiraceae bacterium]|nr:GNAT family N-acetyltransferase [Saprospiraceae bacterium]
MIETPRLILRPLTYDQLLKYIRCDHSLEAELGLNPTQRVLAPELMEALEQTILPQVANPYKNYLFNTLWTAIDKQALQMIGDLCFVGEPNEAGEVEIGYGTYEEFQGQGYMTEMVSGMIAWAKAQPDIRAIIASTDASNVASYRVLEKNHFMQTGSDDGMLKWLRKLED